MAFNQETYNLIKSKIHAMKVVYPTLKEKTDEFVFSALCVKSVFYKNPAIILRESDFSDMIVDGQYDGGVDVLLNDPSSEASDLVICQSKYYASISAEDVKDALFKMAIFYKDMRQGHYEQVNSKVQRRFLSINAETGEESKIKFVFFTSAPKSGIRKDRMEKIVKETLPEIANSVEVLLFFDQDLIEEIKESESRRPTVEVGRILIDKANNLLKYCCGNYEAAIVNVSAQSIKDLYAQHNTNLLSRNLRYHIAGRDIDNAIRDTIINDPASFWLKNNGITIICEDFSVDGREVKMKNFSIVNGGQTTYMIHKSSKIDKNNDLFLPCKIIQVIGNNEDEKNKFSLEIAKATNAQKAIRPVDLKANSPEQIRFSQAMREVGVFYQTKRGETIPTSYRDEYKNSDLTDIGKLCLAAIFQMPGASRNKPSSLYNSQYYEVIFNDKQEQVSKLCRELLYIDFYFRKKFQKKYDKMVADQPNANDRITFAHNARTACIAFTAFASRYKAGNITNQNLQTIFNYAQSETMPNYELHDIFRNLDGYSNILPKGLFEQKDKYEETLDSLFNTLIDAGVVYYSIESRHDSTLTASNFLKQDKNYYRIIEAQWSLIKQKIEQIWDSISL